MVNTLMASKDVHISQCESRIELLEEKIEDLQKFIKEQKMDVS